ncbi:hypothetical protein [Streptomyces sp. NPDC057877]|uniref:hypothetical protein n=1 Tax=Streptomyces sp. NPDC057877 TaxID=3346269 RepID=UPI00368260C0
MGIRMLSRKAAPAPLPPVPACAVGASTARIPTDAATAFRHTAPDLWHRLAHRTGREARDVRQERRERQERQERQAQQARKVRKVREEGDRPPVPPRRPWADLARGYLALLLTLLPRPHATTPTVTVFVATNPVTPDPAN